MERAAGIIKLSSAHERGFYGAGCGIALLDTGIWSGHPDLAGQDKIRAFKDFIYGRQACYDDNGHGTHVAGIAGGTGKASGGRFVGVAPACHFIILKILDQFGNGNVENLQEATDWLLKYKNTYNIRVVNISVGMGKRENGREAIELIAAVEQLWDAGMVVCAAAGNNGPEPGSVGAPGNSRKIITVGSSDDHQNVLVNGKVLRDYSGRGPTRQCVLKPDIVAPGSGIVSCRSVVSKNMRGKEGNLYIQKSGTSMATPMVSGAVAILLEKCPCMTTREVKIRLKNHSTDLQKPHNLQGWGRLHIGKILYE